MASIDLEFDLGDEVYAITDCSVHTERECPTCGHHINKDLSFRQVSKGVIIGIDIKLRKDFDPFYLYTCDIDGIIAKNIDKVYRSRAEAEAVLDASIKDSDSGLVKT